MYPTRLSDPVTTRTNHFCILVLELKLSYMSRPDCRLPRVREEFYTAETKLKQIDAGYTEYTITAYGSQITSDLPI